MKFKLGKRIKLSLALLMTMSIAGSCTAATVSTSYQKSDESFANPERGFFINALTYNLDSPLWLEQLQQARNNNMTLVRRIYVISNFRNSNLSQDFLDFVKKDCETARKAGVKMVVRFAYNWDVSGNDASKDLIISQLEQLRPILKANYDVISYMEAGFIGAWGQWNRSSYNLIDNATLSVTDNSKAIFSKILSVLPTQRMVALPYPLQKIEIFNTTTPPNCCTSLQG